MRSPRHVACFSLIAACAWLPLACEKQPPTGAGTPNAASPPEGETPLVQRPFGKFIDGYRLLDPGQLPRVALQYAPTIGAKQLITSRHDHGMAGWEDGRRVGIEQTPNTVAVISIEALEVTEHGTHVRCDQMGMWVSEEDPARWEEWTAEFERMSQTAMEQMVLATYEPYGRVFSDPTESDTERARTQSVLHLSMLLPVLLPDEPIGIGAVWEMNQVHEVATVPMQMQRRYRLRAVDGSRITVEMSQRHLGTPGPTPTSTHDSAELVSREIFIQGEAVIDLTMPGPVSGWFGSDYTTRARAFKGGEATEIVYRTSFRHSWEPYEPQEE
ncbi:MAG: hypothetical protein KF912_01270 [Phycisphaeraceae bacterium]|nr:hypothetical protein [Phycisphaeraceae bacterium]